jgi:outer membrane immunogenic protein
MSDLVMVTPRVGFAWGPMHIYGKGGYASADVEFEAFATNLGVITATSRAREHGWTAGAGFEYAIWQNLVLGIQYDFVTLNVDDRTFEVAAGFAGPNTGTNIDVNRHMVTARLNLLFNPW